jgi:hypothetical protein
MLKNGRYGPNIPEQPQIAEHIRLISLIAVRSRVM